MAYRQTYRPMEEHREPRNTCVQMISDKGAKTIQREKDSLFNKWCWETLDTHMWKNKIGPAYFTPHTKINRKWKKDLVENLKQKLLEETIRGSYMTLDLEMIFWIQRQKHRLKKRNKLD